MLLDLGKALLPPLVGLRDALKEFASRDFGALWFATNDSRQFL